MDIFDILILLALLAVLVTLGFGLYALFRGGEFGDRPVRDAASDMIRQVLDAGVAAGELGPGLDRDLAADMLWDCYVGNYRRALFGGWDLDRLTGRMRAQIGVLLAAYAAA